MNILLFTIGSSGDVNPFLTIGSALVARGHRVILATNEHFRAQVERHGLEFISLGSEEEYHAAIGNPKLWHPRKGIALLAQRAVLPKMWPVYETIAQYDRRETVVVASTLVFGARLAQEHLGVPLATVVLQPSVFWSTHNPPSMPGLVLPEKAPYWLKGLVLNLLDRFVLDRLYAREVNTFRHELGLGRVRSIFTHWIMSPQRVIGLFPQWFAARQPDWPEQTRLCGFVGDVSGDAAELPAALEVFLADGAPPVVFTPGTAMTQANSFFEASVRAVVDLNQRAILLTSHSAQLPRDLPATVAHVHYAPLAKLLPRCSAIIHHGGIGTCAQGLAAGIPHIVVPRAFDQPDNAARLERLGAGTTISPRRYMASAVSRALGELLDSANTCAACARYVGRENLAANARRVADEIESLVPHRDC